MISLPVVALAVATVFGTIALYRYMPTKVENGYNWFNRWRKVFWTVLIAGAIWTFIRSGRPELILAAIISLGLVTVVILIEKPHKNLV